MQSFPYVAGYVQIGIKTAKNLHLVLAKLFLPEYTDACKMNELNLYDECVDNSGGSLFENNAAQPQKLKRRNPYEEDPVPGSGSGSRARRYELREC